MELIEQYVQAVKQYLPEGQQNDIARELAENLRAQMDDRAEAAGRALTEAEQEAILKQMGNPAVVAGRYQTNPERLSFGREWIGPVLFPLYTRILIISLSLMVLGNFLAAALVGQSFAVALPTIGFYVVLQFAIVTGIFIAAQAHLTRYPDLWDPRHPSTPMMPPKNERLVSRLESLFEVLVVLAVIVMIRAFPATPPALVAAMGLSTVWTLGYWKLFGLTLASIVAPVVTFFCPSWTVFRAGARVVIGVLWIAVLVFVLLAGPWATGAQPTTEVAELTQQINRWLPWNIGAVALVSVVALAFDIRKLVQQVRLQRA